MFDSSNDAITYRVNKDKQLGAIKRRLAEGNEARRFVIQTSAGEIAVYRYGAVEGRSCDQALPLVFNFHGGGYVL